MNKVKYYSNEVNIFADLLRRYICFHEGEDMYKIKLWGLDSYTEMNKLRKKGYVLSDYRKENKTCWHRPTPAIIDEIIKPAYLLYEADTGKAGHNKYNYLNYICYIQKAINNSEKEI